LNKFGKQAEGIAATHYKWGSYFVLIPINTPASNLNIPYISWR